MSEIAENIRRVRERIRAAAEACGRNPAEITLVAVSKNFSPKEIAAAAAAGLVHFGENRVQEAESKIPEFSAMPELTWHMIGHLQSNKAHRAAQLFHSIHSVDSIRLAGRLSQAALALGKSLPVLIQVDLGHEETKFGAETGQIHEIARAIGDLRGDLCSPVVIPDLARRVGMSTSSFHKHFKAVTATTPLQYQKELRLLEARRLLTTGGASVTAAAYEVGYESSSQFSREYARKFGVPPSRDTADATG